MRMDILTSPFGPRTTREPGDDSPVFVVGPSRSGTTLVREILANHPDLWIGPETHYFDDLRAQLRGRESGPLSEAEARRCEDYFLALVDRPYGRGGDPARATRLDRAAFREAALARGGGPDAYFTAYCELLAAQAGKPRWGEKTPRHVFRLDEILRLWPGAKVVCLVRDPRSVVSSYRGWKRESGPGGWRSHGPEDEAWRTDEERARRSYSPFVISMLWRGAMRASLAATARYGSERVRLLRYEDLVVRPESELRALAEWLCLEYDEQLLDVAVRNSSFEVSREAGISSEPIERWRQTLPANEVRLVQACCRGVMEELGYRPERVAAGLIPLIRVWTGVPVGVARAYAVNRKRLGRPSEYVRRRFRAAVR